MKVHGFDVLKEMSERNLDIKLAPQENMIEARIDGAHGWVKMGVETKIVMDLLANKPMVLALIVADGEQFDRVRRELEATE